MLARDQFGLRERELGDAQLVPFTAQTRMSGIDVAGRVVRKGAADAVQRWVREEGGVVPETLEPIVERIARGGGTPLVVAENGRILGVIHLKDIVKQGIAERFAELRRMGIRTVMITGDNPLTAQAIADGGRRRRLPRRGHARRQDGLHQEGAAGRLPRRDDR